MTPPHEYIITLDVNDDGKWRAAASSTTLDGLLLLFTNTYDVPFGPLVECAERVEFHYDRLQAEQRGFRRQGIPPVLQPIQHTAECQSRRAYIKAWTLLWPNYCKLCYAQGGKEYPATREDPDDYDVCLCVNMGLCSRCMLPSQSYSPLRAIAYELYNVARVLDKEMKQAFRVTHTPSVRSDPEWSARYKHYADTWYRTTYHQLSEVAQAYVDLAEQTDHMQDNWDGTHPTKPCIHCGFGFGAHEGDVLPEFDCYCEIEV